MAPTQISTDAEQMWQVELLRRQFLQLVDPNELAIPGSETLRSPDLQARIYNSMFNEANHRVSPPDRYKFRVLKKLVAAMERAIVDPEEDVGFPYLLSSVIGTFLLYEKTLATAVHQSFKETDIKAPQRFQEISDDLTSCLAELLAQPFASESEAAEQKSYVTYSAPTRTLDAPVIRLLEARSLLASSGTTGLRTWEAALFLGAYLYSAAGQDLIRGNSVLELGAGTGFLSILCAKHLGARNTLATDGSREVITDMQTNLSLNGLDCGNLLDTATFLWGHALVGSVLDMNQNTRRYDVVLGADVTYDVGSVPPLIATLRDLFNRYPGVKALISATVRNEQTLKVFTKACGLSTEHPPPFFFVMFSRLTTADINKFNLDRLVVPLPNREEQLGFFFPTSTPIHVYSITGSGDTIDPFAI